jgi:hypothetical protein
LTDSGQESGNSPAPGSSDPLGVRCSTGAALLQPRVVAQPLTMNGDRPFNSHSHRSHLAALKGMNGGRPFNSHSHRSHLAALKGMNGDRPLNSHSHRSHLAALKGQQVHSPGLPRQGLPWGDEPFNNVPRRGSTTLVEPLRGRASKVTAICP